MIRRNVKIAYIGGGSKAWARSFMQDLALAGDLAGEVALYDIDVPAAERNQIIGTKIQQKQEALSDFQYTVSGSLEEALEGADFVIISILPGTFEDMRVDVHVPEAYGILQSVGDTVGPGGVFRALRTVPVYEEFAEAIRKCCPEAWVLNLTNPMSICVKTLYRCFPQIKAFGCCHEVFHTQDFLCCVLREMTGEKATRQDIYTDASGVNHFTWITEARYQNIDIMELLPEFLDRYFDTGYYENGPADQWTRDTFAYGNRVKMDLYKKYGALAAAGDRHLVEFVDNSWYLKDRETVKKWHFGLTTVDWRIANQQRLIRESVEMAQGRMDVPLAPSGEALVTMLRGILGLETVITNVNLPNRGQMPGMPEGSIVETNCIFTNGFVDPIVSRPLPKGALALVRRNCDNIDLLSEGIAERDENKIFASFVNQPLCAGLGMDQARELYDRMREKSRE
ncbi:MAG: alpha-glucosidase/alpha-galactosidase [Lachnospiraceae bacterium]|nr:alpha-glucosidase/alpha-galactosidase [Lachnospiraceae bacterium]